MGLEVGSTLSACSCLAGRATTGHVNEVTGRGRHTSSSKRPSRLDAGGWIVDTPGVRSAGCRAHERRVLRVFPDVADSVWCLPLCSRDGEPVRARHLRARHQSTAIDEAGDDNAGSGASWAHFPRGVGAQASRAVATAEAANRRAMMPAPRTRVGRRAPRPKASCDTLATSFWLTRRSE